MTTKELKGFEITFNIKGDYDEYGCLYVYQDEILAANRDQAVELWSEKHLGMGFINVKASTLI